MAHVELLHEYRVADYNFLLRTEAEMECKECKRLRALLNDVEHSSVMCERIQSLMMECQLLKIIIQQQRGTNNV